MSDDLAQQVRAVAREVAADSVQITSIKRSRNNLLIGAGAFVVLLALVLLPGKGDTVDLESDAQQILNQASHEVLDHLHQYGELPESIINPALASYVELTPGPGNKFTLTCTIDGQTFTSQH